MLENVKNKIIEESSEEKIVFQVDLFINNLYLHIIYRTDSFSVLIDKIYNIK